MRLSFSSISISAISCSLLLAAMPLTADVCVWRDPERTMQRIFPRARDYKTVTVKMSSRAVAAIEEELGLRLDASEKVEFNFYEITGPGSGPARIGTILALAGTGEYGTIEVVVGVSDGRIVGTYIQKSRERVTKALGSREFLDQLNGKTKSDSFDVGGAGAGVIHPAAPDAVVASKVVALAVRKMLVIHSVLTRETDTAQPGRPSP